MPYFVDHTAHRVVVLPPGAGAPSSFTEIGVQTAEACGLTHDQPLSDAQIEALLSDSVEGYRAATPDDQRATAARPSTPTPTPMHPRDRRSSITQRAFNVARTVEVLSWCLLVISVVVGVAVAFSTSTDPTTGQSSHDSVDAGLILIFAGVFQCLVVIMVAVYIQSRTET
ncbi:MAG: hypothetical protein HY828_01620 [Actinobacteria bacterium]|nr:hypothetical protein [Actinomycetota bacterium]